MGSQAELGVYKMGQTIKVLTQQLAESEAREQVLTRALQLAKEMIVANGSDMPNTLTVINKALSSNPSNPMSGE
jgi:hypothetical protein